MINFVNKVVIIEYDKQQYTEKEKEELEAEIFSNVPKYDRVPGTIYYDQKGNHFVIQQIMYDARHLQLTYFVSQIPVQKEPSKILKIN